MIEFAYQPSTWLPYLALVFDLVKGVAWPLAALVAVLVVRKPLGQALTRMMRFSAGGVEAEFAGAQKAFEPSIAGYKLLTPQDTEAIRSVEQSITAGLDNIDATQIQSRLVNTLANNMLERHFAMVTVNIFGGQVELIRAISSADGSLSSSEVSNFFSGQKSKFKELQDYNLDLYLKLLVDSQLINRSDDGISITMFGREYLRLLDKHSQFDNRPF